jgi:hypothetical protein
MAAVLRLFSNGEDYLKAITYTFSNATRHAVIHVYDSMLYDYNVYCLYDAVSST